jgi:hypothetical protein
MYGDPWREQIYSKTELTDPSQNDKGWQTARVAAIERATSRIKNFSLAPQTPFQFIQASMLTKLTAEDGYTALRS